MNEIVRWQNHFEMLDFVVIHWQNCFTIWCWTLFFFSFLVGGGRPLPITFSYAEYELPIMKFLIINGCIHFENEMGRENIWKMIVRSFCNVANFVSIDARVWFLVLETYNVQQHYCFHSKKSFSKFVWHGSFSLGAQER